MTKIFLLNLMIKTQRNEGKCLFIQQKQKVLAFEKHGNICIQSFVKRTIQDNLAYL